MEMPWMETASGRKWNPFDLVENFTITDLVLGISRTIRYNGQMSPTVNWYSVAEHSWLLWDWARRNRPEMDARTRLTLLCHDLPEGLVGDLVKPLKVVMPQFVDVEDRLWAAVARRLDLHEKIPAEVKELDARIIVDERRQLLLPSGNRWGTDDLEPLGVTIRQLDPKRAHDVFMDALRVEGVDWA